MASYRTEPRYCLDCDTLLTSHRNEVKRCKSCARKYQYSTRPETHPMKGKLGEQSANFIDGRSLKTYYCLDCKKEINYTAIRCKKCADIAKIKNYPQLYCVDCNKELSKKAEYNEIERCRSCARKYYLKFNPMPTGKDSHRYIHGEGYAPYPLEFNDVLKESIRKRDNYICQNCGMTEEEHLIVHGQVLHVHHIDYDKKNCKKDNLITTCQECNIRANFNIEYWIEFYKKLMEKISCPKNE